LKVTREKLLPRLEAKILREGTNCQTWVREEEAERKRLNYWSSEHNIREVECRPSPRWMGEDAKIAGVLPPMILNT
jgi:hypothetical protein